MNKEYAFLKPIVDIEQLNDIYYQNQKRFTEDKQTLNITISKINKNKISHLELNKLMSIGLVDKYNTKEIFDRCIDIGKNLKQRIINIEEKHKAIPRGYDHLNKTLSKYKSEIFNKTLINDVDDILRNYNHSIYYDFDGNNTYSKDEMFLIFLYETYEVLELFISMLRENTDDKTIYNYYYFDIYDYDVEVVLNNYLSKYNKIDKLNFCLLKNDLSIEDIGEIEEYDLCITSDKIASGIMFELKNSISSITNGKSYSICKDCHNLFRKSKSTQEACKDKECLKARDRNDERHKRYQNKKSIK